MKLFTVLFILSLMITSAAQARPTHPVHPHSASPSSNVLSADVKIGDAPNLSLMVADTPEEMQIGLMGVTSLPADGGMVFAYPSLVTGGYWMYNTLIPLDIAFVKHGQITSIFTMQPCTTAPEYCQVYKPRGTYNMAIEVNAGFFAQHDVEVGDKVDLSYRY